MRENGQPHINSRQATSSTVGQKTAAVQPPLPAMPGPNHEQAAELLLGTMPPCGVEGQQHTPGLSQDCMKVFNWAKTATIDMKSGLLLATQRFKGLIC